MLSWDWILQGYYLGSADDIFWKILAQYTNFEVLSLSPQVQVLSLGIFDEVSVDQSCNKVTVLTA